MIISKINKIWLSILLMLFFFIFNLFLSFQTLYNNSTESQNIFLHIAVSSIFYILSIISFIQYLFFKESTYLYYVLYLLQNLAYYSLIFSYKANTDGAYVDFFREVRGYLSLPLLSLNYCTYAYFMIAFLQLKTKDAVSYKWADIFGKLFFLIFTLTIISYIVIKNSTVGDAVRTIFLVLCMPLGIAGITIIYRRVKNIFTTILCAGTVFFYAGSVLGFIFSFGLAHYPANIFPFNNWIFYTELGATLEAIMFFSSFAYRNKILADEEREAQQKLQVIRDDIARDLHDDIGASLSNINILNELAKRNANNPLKANEYLTKASEDIQHVSEGLNDIVWNINPKYDDLENLFIKMKRYAADMMDGKNIKYEIIFPNKTDGITLDMHKRKDLYFIFKEAVNNLIKYSEADNAFISLHIQHQHLKLIIKDDGKGFNKDTVVYGNGLQNIKHRAAIIHSLLNIQSSAGNGTLITMEMDL